MSEHPGTEEIQATMRGPLLFVVFGLFLHPPFSDLDTVDCTANSLGREKKRASPNLSNIMVSVYVSM